MYKRVLYLSFAIIIFLFWCVSLQAERFKLARTSPTGEKIKIGEQMIGPGNEFSDQEPIHWESNTLVKGFTAYSLDNPGRRLVVSKNAYKKHTNRNLSWKDFLASLISKGGDDMYLFEVNEKAIPYDGNHVICYHFSIWEDEEVGFDIPIDLSASYYFSIDNGILRLIESLDEGIKISGLFLSSFGSGEHNVRILKKTEDQLIPSTIATYVIEILD